MVTFAQSSMKDCTIQRKASINFDHHDQNCVDNQGKTKILKRISKTLAFFQFSQQRTF